MKKVSGNGTFTWEPRGERQVALRDLIKERRIVFATGCAGTGKSLVSVFCGLEELARGARRGGVERLVVTRPLVSAGNEIGFLPGTLDDKAEPFMRSIRDLIIASGSEHIQSWLYGSDPPVEFIPTEMLRGLTFENAFIIVDEAANLTREQFKLTMCRLGTGSKMVFAGDVAQSDIGSKSGLLEAVNLFRGNPLFGHVNFTIDDVQREPIIKEVIRAYGEPKGMENWS